MKKLCIVFISLSTLLILSCDREHTCVCDIYFEDTYIGSEPESVVKGKPKKAEEECEKGNSETVENGLTTAVECRLKL